MESDLRPARHLDIFVSLLSAAFFFAIGFAMLKFGHPHEDAYILFIYSEELASSGRIAYFADGPRAEGATDFLWMIVIAGLNFLGVSSAHAALALNSIGIALIAAIIISTVRQKEGSLAVAYVSALCFPLAAIVHSGYGGFSTPLYCSLVLLAFNSLTSPSSRMITSVPILSIALGLFRPDGVVIGVAITLCGLFLCPKPQLKRYLGHCVFALVLGGAYFIWRWSYFGEILPLPLIVKSSADSVLPGWDVNVDWLMNNLFLTLGLVSMIFILRTQSLVILIPLAVFFLFLSFGVQSQNISFRFQAPIASVLTLWLVVGASVFFVATKKLVGRLLMLLFVFAVMVKDVEPELRRTAQYLTNSDYSNFFPGHLSDRLEVRPKVALTEAGRFAYWLPSERVDLVGLNTSYTAKNGADVEFISSLEADLFFVHLAHTVDFPCDGNYCELTWQEIQDRIESVPPSSELGNRVTQAPLAVMDYLIDQKALYQIFVVRLGQSHKHLYAIARDGVVKTDDFLAALEDSFSEAGRFSYADRWKGRIR